MVSQVVVPDWVSEYAPDAAAHLSRAQSVLPDQVGPVILELARLRIASLLRNESALSRRAPESVSAGLTEEMVEAIAQWPTSELFSEGDRACLALAEQFVIDVGGVSGEDVARVLAVLGPPGLYGFVQALYLFDMTQRLELSLGAVVRDQTGGQDQL
jgi:hypothetical protein